MTRGPVACAAALAVALGASALPAAAAGATRACGKVTNPYPGERYGGTELRRIRATGLRCPAARRVAKGAGLAAQLEAAHPWAGGPPRRRSSATAAPRRARRPSAAGG